MTPAQRDAVVAEAWTWLHTPYDHHQRLKGCGVDCAQILCAVYEACGLVPHVETGYYAVDWHLHHNEEIYMRNLAQHCVEVEVPQHGDIALFKFGRCFSHGAIVVHDGLLIHSYLGRGVIASRADEEPLEGRDVKYWTTQ